LADSFNSIPNCKVLAWCVFFGGRPKPFPQKKHLGTEKGLEKISPCPSETVTPNYKEWYRAWQSVKNGGSPKNANRFWPVKPAKVLKRTFRGKASARACQQPIQNESYHAVSTSIKTLVMQK
jgi:hypothetical protein